MLQFLYRAGGLWKQFWSADETESPLERSAERLGISELEERLMLAGDLMTLELGSDLYLFGDSDDNDLEVSGTNGSIDIRGLNGTTIDGETEFSTNAKSLFVYLGDGTNRFSVEELNTGGSLLIFGGEQTDQVEVINSEFTQLKIHTFGGEDSIGVNGVTINGKTIIHSGSGSDLVSIRGSQFEGSLILHNGSGDDSTVVDQSQVNGHAILFQGSGDDNLAWSSTDVGGLFLNFGGQGDDLVRIRGSEVGGPTLLLGGVGDDQFFVQSDNRFQSRVYQFGGPGEDRIENGATLDRGQRFYGLEQFRVDSTPFDQRIDDPESGAVSRSDALQANLVEPQVLVLDLTQNDTIESSNTLLTDESVFNIQGTTLPGSTVQADVDRDGAFDATTTADNSGFFSFDIGLIHDSINNGANQPLVRSVSRGGSIEEESFDVHLAEGDVVRLETTFGNIDMEMLDDETPLTAANFINYLDRYTNSIFHRSARTQSGGDFVIQGGGFTFENGVVSEIVEDAPVVSENSTSSSNLRGTVGLALPGTADGVFVDDGTSQWFINLSDSNTTLDSSFTVFARVIGDGLLVADAIHDLTTFDISGDFSQSALREVPLIGYDSQQTADENNFVFVSRAMVIL